MLSKKAAKNFKQAAVEKLVEPDSIESFCDAIRAQCKSIVTINGSFDLLHPGHLEMLYQARLQGDFFLVLLNTDESIKQYKGPNRPINSLEERKLNMAALWMVDAISWFSEVNPIDILGKIRPDVHVNGSEYGENCIEKDVVESGSGRIHVVQLVEGFSSSNLIERIQALCV